MDSAVLWTNSDWLRRECLPTRLGQPPREHAVGGRLPTDSTMGTQRSKASNHTKEWIEILVKKKEAKGLMPRR